MRNHSPIDRLKESLLKQQIFFDENASELLNGFEGAAERAFMKDLVARYCSRIARLINGQEARPETLVWIGTRVTVRNETDQIEETFTIVLPEEVDPDEGRISFLSPIGQKLLLSRIGYRAEIDSPGGKYEVTVKDLSFDE